MAGEIENFGKKRNTNGFDKNPENINNKGRPPKLLTNIINTLKSMGIERAEKKQIAEAYTMLINLTEEQLEDIKSDKESPIILKIAAKSLLSDRSFDYMDRMLDRSLGKAEETVNNNVDIKDKISAEDKDLVKSFLSKRRDNEEK